MERMNKKVALGARARAWLGTSRSSRKIFVLGTGRSGTHWLGYILAAHPDVKATIEKPGLFHNVTTAAIDQQKRKKLVRKIVRQYRWEHAKVAPKYYLDKSHPNLWLAEDLMHSFDDAVFVCIVRSPYAVTASSFKHANVNKRFKTWRSYPVPNELLGIHEDNVSEYADLSLAGRSAVRWAAHCKRIYELQKAHPDRVAVVNYEKLITDHKTQLPKLKKVIGLSRNIPSPTIRKESLDKWKNELSDEDIKDIDNILNESGRYGY